MTGEFINLPDVDLGITDPEIIGKLEYLGREFRKAQIGVVRSCLTLGKILSDVRDLLEKYPGKIDTWADGFGISRRTAYNYMAAYDRFGNCATVALLQDTALYELAPSETPKLAVSAALKMTEKGQLVTGKIAKELIAKYSKPAAPKDERAKDRHATADTENRTEADGGDPIRADEEDPDSCLDSGLPHKWISDGNGDRYCETCKVDHPDNDVRPDPREVAVKHLTGIAATLVQARINFNAVCQDLGSRPASYDQIMADADKALVSIRRWAKELLS